MTEQKKIETEEKKPNLPKRKRALLRIKRMSLGSDLREWLADQDAKRKEADELKAELHRTSGRRGVDRIPTRLQAGESKSHLLREVDPSARHIVRGSKGEARREKKKKANARRREALKKAYPWRKQ